MSTNRRILGIAITVAMTLLAIGSLELLNDWVGDVGAMLWVAAGFWWPFVAGIAWGAGGDNNTGRVIGGLIGAAVVLAPGIGYALVESPDMTDLQLPLLWALFTPLAFMQGLLALPVGTRVRKRASS